MGRGLGFGARGEGCSFKARALGEGVQWDWRKEIHTPDVSNTGSLGLGFSERLWRIYMEPDGDIPSSTESTIVNLLKYAYVVYAFLRWTLEH